MFPLVDVVCLEIYTSRSRGFLTKYVFRRVFLHVHADGVVEIYHECQKESSTLLGALRVAVLYTVVATLSISEQLNVFQSS